MVRNWFFELILILILIKIYEGIGFGSNVVRTQFIILVKANFIFGFGIQNKKKKNWNTPLFMLRTILNILGHSIFWSSLWDPYYKKMAWRVNVQSNFYLEQSCRFFPIGIWDFETQMKGSYESSWQMVFCTHAKIGSVREQAMVFMPRTIKYLCPNPLNEIKKRNRKIKIKKIPP